jgi:arabinogalactan endo-1,4-beta-galactosidase
MPSCQTCVKDCAQNFNQMLPAIVTDFQRRGFKITYVPMAEETMMCAGSGYLKGLCAVGQVHPISAGYLRMASVFEYSILQSWKPPLSSNISASHPWSGTDMSQLQNENNQPFRAFSNSTITPALQIMADAGADTFRMRMWNDPCASHRCQNKTLYSYANLTGVLDMARKCASTTPPLRFVLDLHYSDWWADPAHQAKPYAWINKSFAELKQAVYDFTEQTVSALVAQHTPPIAVQIGNEITNGMLWATEFQSCEDGGKLWGCEPDQADAWARFASLVDEGIAAVKSACLECDIAIHTDLGNHIATDGIIWVQEWYGNLSLHLKQEYNRIGLSMYPRWDSGTTFENIPKLGSLAAAFPGKKIYIAETSYPADGDVQPEKHYPSSPNGQLSYLQDVRNAMAQALPAEQNGGVLWWEGNENGWNSLFDENFVARPALLQGFK